eukprot:3378006-Rhodomonas_salina.2
MRTRERSRGKKGVRAGDQEIEIERASRLWGGRRGCDLLERGRRGTHGAESAVVAAVRLELALLPPQLLLVAPILHHRVPRLRHLPAASASGISIRPGKQRRLD